MEITEWTITENYWDYKVENTLFTYDENERQENLINKNNAELILKPKFIAVDVVWLRWLWLSPLDKQLYWFIEFFLYHNDRFYCTNEQIAKLFEVSINTVSSSISKLEWIWLIKSHYKIRAWWWKIRFISLTHKNCELYTQNLWRIDNKIIENNKINIINNNTEQSSENKNNSSSINTLALKEKEKSSAKKEKEIQELWKREKIDYLINQIKSICDGMNIAYDKTMDRQFAKHILTAKEYGEFCEKIKQDRITFALNVLIASIKINYWKWPLAWPKKIYQNYADLYNQAKQKAPKIQTPTINVL